MDNETFEPHINDSQHEAMVDCCLGAHPEAWYKFKRFECLSLLNLYYYQHELVTLDAEIFGTPEIPKDWKSLTDDKWRKLRTTIKEYQGAIQLFKQTAQMKRPTLQERQTCTSLLNRNLRAPQYQIGHDAMGMLDLSPEALDTTQDSLRAMIRTQMLTVDLRSTSYYGPGVGTPPPGSQTSLGQDEPVVDQRRATHRINKAYVLSERPALALPVNSKQDRFIRLIVGIVAAATLLVPLVVLYKIRNPDYVILATCLFVLAFASMVSMIGKKSTAEVMVAVATYAAVLVVFVGQTISPRAAA